MSRRLLDGVKYGSGTCSECGRIVPKGSDGLLKHHKDYRGLKTLYSHPRQCAGSKTAPKAVEPIVGSLL